MSAPELGKTPTGPVSSTHAASRSGAGRGPRSPRRHSSAQIATGPVGVFPSSGPDTCERLGLADLPASYAAEAKRFTELREALFARLGRPGTGSTLPSGPCVGEADARAIVQQELERHGYAGWRIEVAGGAHGEGFSTERPCAGLAFDHERKVVTLVPESPR